MSIDLRAYPHSRPDRVVHHLPRYDYDQRGGFGHGWQAHCGSDPIAPVRMFQWEAINDLPEDAGVRVLTVGRYLVFEPYRVALCPAVPFHLTVEYRREARK